MYLAFAAVFLLGGAAGAASAHAYVTRSLLSGDDGGELRDRRRLEALKRELGLRNAQAERIWSVFVSHRAEHRSLVRAAFERCGEPLRDERARVDAEVRKELDGAQQQRFDELVRQAHERFPFGPKGQ